MSGQPIPVKLALLVALLALGLPGCQSTPAVTYEDTEKVETLTVGFGATDVQMMAEEMINDLNSYPRLPKKEGDDPRLILLLSQVRNKTSEHIDMKNVMTSIRNGLIRGGQFRFAADKDRREEILEEIEYHESGAVDPNKAKKFGRQIGADVFLSGELTSIDKKSGAVKLVHYKLTLILEGIETAEIIWSNEKELRKRKG